MSIKDRIAKLENSKVETKPTQYYKPGNGFACLGLDPEQLKAEALADHTSIAEIAARKLGLPGSRELYMLFKAKAEGNLPHETGLSK
jgi:hypothetical protein